MSSVYRDTYPDTWVAVDGQDRPVEVCGKGGVPGPRDRKVGIFYWTWHEDWSRAGGDERDGPFNVSKILAEYPDALDDPDCPAWGPGKHHWGEPMFGYYLNTDEYVIRKHAQMLCDAGVDFLAFDTTNFKNELVNGEHPMYFRKATILLCDTYLKIIAEGKPVPKLSFLCPFWECVVGRGEPDSDCVETMYRDFYTKPEYMPLWYMVDGKPLILYHPDLVKDKKLLDSFTFRRNMPDYHLDPSGTDQWPWLENYPQRPYYASSDPSQPEMVCVGVAQNSVIDPAGGWRLGSMGERDENGRFIARGRSFHNGVEPQPGEPLCQPEKGYNILEQWSRALELDPKSVFVTGWNEWVMYKRPTFLHYTNEAGTFCDQFNHEFSRDIEPMRGGHQDDYYYQFVQKVREFKGARPMAAALPISKDFPVADLSQWAKIKNEYYDDEGDNIGRHAKGYGTMEYFVQKGLNDFLLLKAAHTEENIYFYAKTSEPITRYVHGHGAWMQLLIKVNDQSLAGWEGFNFTVNRHLKNATTSVLEFSAGGWDWKPVCEVPLHIEGSEMALCIPRKALCIEGRPVDISFKWIDSMNPQDDILQLYTQGDTAPNGRFAYLYKE